MRYTKLLLTVLIAFALGNVVFAREPVTISQQELNEIISQEGDSAYSEKEARDLVLDIYPLVESAAGRKFKHPPIVELIDRSEMTKVLIKEGLVLSKDPAVNENIYSTLSACILGKYGVIDDTVYLLPKNLLPLMKLYRVDLKLSNSILKLIIAHELTHALQSQEIDLSKALSIENLEERQAYNAMIEGHATFIEDRVGKQLGLDDVLLEMSRMISAGTIKLDDPAYDIQNQTLASYYEQIYLGGEKFIDYHYKQGGNERIWQIMANPPRKTMIITHPEMYAAVFKPSLNYEEVLDGLEQDLGKEDWLQVRNFEIGNILAQAAYVKMDKQERDEILNDVEHIQSLLAQSENATANVSLFVFKTPSKIPNYINSLEKVAKNNIDELRGNSQLQIIDESFDDFPSVKGDFGRRVKYSLKMNGTKTSCYVVRICRNNLMLEFAFINLKIKDSTIVAMAQKIFNRYESLIKSHAA